MKNSFEIRGDVTCVFVNGKGRVHECLIDTNDLSRVSEFPNSWYARFDKNTQKFYVSGFIGRKMFHIHRWITDVEDDMFVDHRDIDPLNNCRGNLRTVTDAENKQNRSIQRNNKSGFRGVSWYRSYEKWQAEYKLNGKRHHLGYFDTIEEAAQAVKTARKSKMPFSTF